MSQSKPTHNIVANKPTGENVSDIQSLTLRVENLSQSVDWWNLAMVWTAWAAALVATMAGITLGIALSKTKTRDKAQSELDSAKERQHSLDLKGQDLKIEQTKKETAFLREQAEHEALERAKIDERLTLSGPRFRILERNAPAIIERLAPFAGQRISSAIYERVPRKYSETEGTF